jgi:hypothetical protein
MEVVLQRSVCEFFPSLDQESDVPGYIFVIAFLIGIQVTVENATKGGETERRDGELS